MRLRRAEDRYSHGDGKNVDFRERTTVRIFRNSVIFPDEIVDRVLDFFAWPSFNWFRIAMIIRDDFRHFNSDEESDGIFTDSDYFYEGISDTEFERKSSLNHQDGLPIPKNRNSFRRVLGSKRVFSSGIFTLD